MAQLLASSLTTVRRGWCRREIIFYDTSPFVGVKNNAVGKIIPQFSLKTRNFCPAQKTL
jgi:hypothetical protein